MDCYKEYQICKVRGHVPSNAMLTVHPPLMVCERCGTHYRYEQTLIEQNVPEQPLKAQEE